MGESISSLDGVKVLALSRLMSLFMLGAAHLAFGADISDLYVKTFGDPSNPAVIYVHGGPGYDSNDFEVTTAQKLADRGLFVVVYDQRGQGRSKATSAENFSYRVYADDIKALIDQLRLVEPSLIGHSHGGPIVLAFDQFYPGIAKKIALVAAPVDFWSSLMSMIETCGQRYSREGNESALLRVAFLKSKLTYEYEAMSELERIYVVAELFQVHGLAGCKLYTPVVQTEEAKELRKLIAANPIPQPVAGRQSAMPGFLKNEDYVRRNSLDHLFANRQHFCGIYGDEDGLFTPVGLGMIKNYLNLEGEPQRMVVIPGASHGVYVDQREKFLDALTDVCGLGRR